MHLSACQCVKALVFTLACLGATPRRAECGQRFVLSDEGITESQVDEAPRAPYGMTVPAVVDDRHFYMAWFEERRGQLLQRGKRSRWDDLPSPKALAVLMKKSIFCLSTTGKVYERFHNQVKWVYVRHENPSELPLVSLTAVRNRGTYFASDSQGRVFQRLRVENGLGWIDVTNKNDRIFLSGVASEDGNVYFISSDGRLLERQFAQSPTAEDPNVGGHGLWSDHGKPKGNKGSVAVASIVDAHTLSFESIFCVGTDGTSPQRTRSQPGLLDLMS